MFIGYLFLSSYFYLLFPETERKER